jgi:hypothetical protein
MSAPAAENELAETCYGSENLTREPLYRLTVRASPSDWGPIDGKQEMSRTWRRGRGSREFRIDRRSLIADPNCTTLADKFRKCLPFRLGRNIREDCSVEDHQLCVFGRQRNDIR